MNKSQIKRILNRTLLIGADICKQELSIPNSGGRRRDIKGKSIENYVNTLITQVIKDKNLPYAIKQNYTIQFEKDYSINADHVVLNNKNSPLFIIESKDYADSNMLASLMFKSQSMIKKYKNSKCIGIFMQESGQGIHQVETMKKYNGIPKNKMSVYNFEGSCSVFNRKRNPSNTTYILDYMVEELIDYTQGLYNYLYKTIK
jgi:hypothetical protein